MLNCYNSIVWRPTLSESALSWRSGYVPAERYLPLQVEEHGIPTYLTK